MTVEELLNRVSSKELTEWMAFFSLEPFGTEVEDLRAGIIASTIANVNRDPKKQPQPYKPKDFMPDYTNTSHSNGQSVEEQKKIVMLWNSLLGGTVKK